MAWMVGLFCGKSRRNFQPLIMSLNSSSRSPNLQEGGTNNASSSVSKQSEPNVKKELVFALKKTEELGLQKDYVEADASFEVLALMHKSNARFSLRQMKKFDEEGKFEEDEEVEKKHLAPQHRRFLTYPKVGPGTPIKREKVNNSQKLDRAAAAAHKYQMTRMGFVDHDVSENMLTAHKGLASSIEDKIQLSILQGDFDNLKGSGKPLDEYVNPFVDRTTDLAYELLRKNGVKPEWIELQQCMGSLKDGLKARLRVEWAGYCLQYDADQRRRRALSATTSSSVNNAITVTKDKISGEVRVTGEKFIMPASKGDFTSRMMKSYEHDERICNFKVDAYNLQVPSHVLTRGRVSLEYEIIRCSSEVFASPEDAYSAQQQGKDIAQSVQHIRMAAANDVNGRDRGTKGCMNFGVATRPTYEELMGGTGTAQYSYVGGESTGWSGSGRNAMQDKKKDVVNSNELAFRALMAPIDGLANALQRWMEKW